ncbi:ATP-binding protein [Bacteroides sp. 51]|uniref:sensor histidine kinase n=1 Tax=Bacteroides sp. 51 TaxID=2302938 RepID=UPI0013D59E4D|nr:ATP-binding protein [Bacteroides sp. 51]NDV81863.1 histidine kinase [Bacteroides sp. 51]
MIPYFKHSSLILVLFIVVFSPALSAKQTYNILFIQSYTERDTWAREFNEELRKGFEEQSLSVNITTEYLNSRYWRVVGEEEIMRRMCARARERGTDLIVTSHDEALYTLLTCGDPLPTTVPVVFTGVQFPNYKLLRTYPNATGTTTPLAYNKLLNTIKEVFPDRKKVVVLSEETTLGRWGLQAFKEEWRNFLSENSGYTIKDFNVTLDPLTDIVSEIQLSRDIRNSVVIVPYWGLFMPSIAKVSKAPTFSTNGSALMQGGFCVAAPSPADEAREVVKRAVKILGGAKPESLEISESTNQLTYDYKQLEFFRVKKERIPKNGVIINEPYMEKYGVWYAILYAVILGLLVLLVVRLVAVNRRESRRRMHAQTKLLIQERMVAQRNEFDNVFHSIRDAVITYDMDYRIHFVNRAMLQALELPVPKNVESRPYEGQITGSLCIFIHNGESILSDLLKKVATDGVSVPIPENTFLQAIHNKKYFPVSGEIVPLRANGKQTGMVLSFRNISVEALQKRYYNMAIVESMIYPWQYNRTEDSFSFPAEYNARMGLRDGIVKRNDIDANIHPEDLKETHRLFSTVIDGHAQNVRLIFRQRNAAHAYEWWEFRITTIGGLTEGMPFEVIGVCQSIQRYKSTEEELIAARDRALQADKLKTAFLANMSHEIRTPLNAIVGFSDLLKDYQMFSEEEIEQFIATINKNCELLLALISDILDLSRVESGTMDFQFSPYFLPIIMQEIYDSQRLNMPSGVQLVKAIPEESEKTLITDSVRLKQVLNNLINNAAKFTTSGSITFGYTEEPGFTSFFVEDTGIGLSQEDKDRIFERFYKVDSFTQGAGLGLSITQTIVGRLNGTISVESEKGKGTRFTVRIPDRNN